MTIFSVLNILNISVAIPYDKRMDKYLHGLYKNLSDEIKDKLNINISYLPINDNSIANLLKNECNIKTNQDIVNLYRAIHNFYLIGNNDKVIDIIVNAL